MIDFDINLDAIKVATRRVNNNNKRRAQLQVCLNGLVCPICARDLEKCIDDNRNISHKCTSNTCNFVWPPSKDEPDAHTYSGPGTGAKITLNRFVERLDDSN